MRHVTCCESDGCNAPDPTEDTATQQLLVNEQPVTQADTIACYQSLQLGELISPEVPPAVHPVISSANRLPAPSGSANPTVCYSAKLDVCASGAKACTPEEAAVGVWVWQYRPMHMAACYMQQWMANSNLSSTYQSVGCCVTDLCNKPDKSSDHETQVCILVATRLLLEREPGRERVRV